MPCKKGIRRRRQNAENEAKKFQKLMLHKVEMIIRLINRKKNKLSPLKAAVAELETEIKQLEAQKIELMVAAGMNVNVLSATEENEVEAPSSSTSATLPEPTSTVTSVEEPAESSSVAVPQPAIPSTSVTLVKQTAPSTSDTFLEPFLPFATETPIPAPRTTFLRPFFGSRSVTIVDSQSTYSTNISEWLKTPDAIATHAEPAPFDRQDINGGVNKSNRRKGLVTRKIIKVDGVEVSVDPLYVKQVTPDCNDEIL